MKIHPNDYPPLTTSQVVQLEQQGCYAKDWSKVRINPQSDFSLIRNVRFYGNVEVGLIFASSEKENGIFNATIKDCIIGDDVYISSVGGELRGCEIGNHVKIENVGRIVFDEEASCGLGVVVSVLDETGSRPVYIYPGISAQMAALMAYKPQWTENVLLPMIQDYYYEHPLSTSIGDNVEILDTVCMINVHIDRDVKIEGCKHLKNGAVLNNAPQGSGLAYVGIGVDAENFIIEDAEVSTSATLRNCYVGQGCAIVKGFTAHDSLFFANSACENGEACAVFAGPYTVSMHKSSLLIGGQYMFMNAGSGTNSSNHMYKLGPAHWGIMERGVKTSSDAYMMWSGKIGAFSLLMGSHKTHPDTSEFPFAYLFSNVKNETIVVPGVMLKSCGLLRDGTKWPARDKRVKYKLPFNDNVCFDVLNPLTVGTMINALKTFRQIRVSEIDKDGFHTYKGLKIKPSSILKGEEFYRLAILKYFHEKTERKDLSSIEAREMQWADFAGQLIPVSSIKPAFEKETLHDIKKVFSDAFMNYPELEFQWIKWQLESGWDKEMVQAAKAAETLNKMIETDRVNSREMLTQQNNLLSV